MADRVANEGEFDSEGRSNDGDSSDYGDIEDMEFYPPQDSRREARPSVPQLPLQGLRPGIPVPTQDTAPREAQGSGRGQMRIDLLSEAFCFERELIRQATTERGMTMRGVVAAAFDEALNVHQSQLTLYDVREITSPTQLRSNSHLAVAIQSSRFSVDELENLIRERKDCERQCDSQRRRFGEYESTIRRLEHLLKESKLRLQEKEAENKRLIEDNRMLRQAIPQRSITPSQLSSTSASPRILPPATASQSRVTASLEHLRCLVTENQQLVSQLSQVARNPTVESALTQHDGGHYSSHHSFPSPAM